MKVLKTKEVINKSWKDGTVKSLVKDESGKDVILKKKYDRNTLPLAQKGLKPKWSIKKRQWLCDISDEELNGTDKSEGLVSLCRLKDKKGMKITRADRFDRTDPFFSHRELVILMREGEALIEDENYMDKVMIGCLTATPEVAVMGVDNVNDIRVKHILTDSNKRDEEHNKRINLEEKAWKHFFKASNENKRIIARALGYKVDKDTSVDKLDTLLKKSIDNNTAQYVEVSSLSKEDLLFQDMVNQAREKGYIRRNKGKWTLFGQEVGHKNIDIINFLKDPNNTETFDKLEKNLES